MGQWKLVGVLFLSVSLCSTESEDVEEVLEVGGEKRISNHLGEEETRVRT